MTMTVRGRAEAAPEPTVEPGVEDPTVRGRWWLAVAVVAALVPALGGAVWWYLAAGPGAYTSVPDGLLAATVAEAQVSLEDAGLEVATVEAFHDTAPAGVVVAAAPLAGEQIRKGGLVTLTVSRGPDLRAVFVEGVGQGVAGTEAALTVAGLVPDLAGVMADVPFLCHIRRGTEISPKDPYLEVAQYLSVQRAHVEQAFRTLSYVDAVNFARRATAPALISVGLMDQICPPSTVYAAINHYGSRRADGGERPAVDVVEYPFNDHEGGDAHQQARQLAWVAQRLARA